VAAIKIEVYALGFVHVALARPTDPMKAERVWRLYQALRPQIEALERAARVEGARVELAQEGSGR
jgi:hypothetical protein